MGPTEYLFTPGGIREPLLSIRPGDGQFFSLINLDNGAVVAQRFTTGPDVTPPFPVTNFVATPGALRNTLTWTNPLSGDFVATMIRYRTDGQYPSGPADGTLLIDKVNSAGSNDSYRHDGLNSHLTYHYAAFAHDGTPNYAARATANATPMPAGDFEPDGDVDQEDFGQFQVCLSGNGVLYEPGCGPADFNLDGDVDGDDFTIFQSCMAGPDNSPGC